MDCFLTLMIVLVTWRWTGCGLILDLSVCVVTRRWTECGLILVLSVCVGDLEMDSMWIDT